MTIRRIDTCSLQVHLQHGQIKGYYVGYRRAEPVSPYKYETVQVGGGGDHAETAMSLVIQGLAKFTKYTVTVQVLPCHLCQGIDLH